MAATKKKDDAPGVELLHKDGKRAHTASTPAELHSLLSQGYSIKEKGVAVHEAAERLTGNASAEPVTGTGGQQPANSSSQGEGTGGKGTSA